MECFDIPQFWYHFTNIRQVIQVERNSVSFRKRHISLCETGLATFCIVTISSIHYGAVLKKKGDFEETLPICQVIFSIQFEVQSAPI